MAMPVRENAVPAAVTRSALRLRLLPLCVRLLPLCERNQRRDLLDDRVADNPSRDGVEAGEAALGVAIDKPCRAKKNRNIIKIEIILNVNTAYP